MDVETPLDALIAIYDLLEVTRFLYKKRSTLHRDISAGNVLIQAELSTVTKEMEDEFEEMNFASFLLGDDGPNPEAKQLQMLLLLIDFDMSKHTKEGRERPTKPQTGIPIFMARAVRQGQISKGDHKFSPMPQLNYRQNRYKQYLEERLQMFLPNEEERVVLKANKKLEPFGHELRYDVESVFLVVPLVSSSSKAQR
ncbi:hypothetical protein CPB86DRAFT_820629 [Serendipita vermifera]|nr:hypothetical protein CPB86DRAFT_820629 [Serendipita vermifera]